MDSPKPARNGGHWHQIGEPVAAYTPPVRRKTAPVVNIAWDLLQATYEAAASPERVKTLADKLGVQPFACHALGVGYALDKGAFTFPMKTAAGSICGIQFRTLAGDKWMVKGSALGLFLPDCEHQADTLTIVEGASDTLAALSIGWSFSVARPNCSAIVDVLVEYVRLSKARRVVLVPDMDANGAGVRGADALQAKLRVPSKQWLPCGYKDLRQFVQAGGTASIAESMLKDLLWQQPNCACGNSSQALPPGRQGRVYSQEVSMSRNNSGNGRMSDRIGCGSPPSDGSAAEITENPSKTA